MKNLNALGKKTLGVIVLLIGTFLLIGTLYYLLRDIPIWVFGKTVPGRIEELWVENISEPGAKELAFKYYLRYSFLTENGLRIENSRPLSATEWSRQGEGSQIDISYFPLIPSHNRIDDSNFILPFLCMYIPLIVVGWISLTFGWHLLTIDSSTGNLDEWKNFYQRRFGKNLGHLDSQKK